jgi:hypothetical protein
MYRIRKITQSKEEKVAIKLASIVTDFTLDLEAVGRYLATAVPHILYTRLTEVLESAEFQHETNTEYDTKWKVYKD